MICCYIFVDTCIFLLSDLKFDVLAESRHIWLCLTCSYVSNYVPFKPSFRILFGKCVIFYTFDNRNLMANKTERKKILNCQTKELRSVTGWIKCGMMSFCLCVCLSISCRLSFNQIPKSMTKKKRQEKITSNNRVLLPSKRR